MKPLIIEADKAPEDFFVKHPGGGYLEANIYFAATETPAGRVCLMADIAIQASRTSVVFHSPPLERFSTVDAASERALALAREHGIEHVFLTVP